MNNDLLHRYQQAQELLDGIGYKKMVINDDLRPHWIGDSDYFWYERDEVKAKSYRLVDCKKGSNQPAFDHHALAHALSAATGGATDGQRLDIQVTEITLNPYQIHFSCLDQCWIYNADNSTCYAVEKSPIVDGIISPDKKQIAFIRDHNVWVREGSKGEEKALTHDGVEDCCYGKAAAISGISTVPFEAIWSPDAKYIFTFQLDIRGVRTCMSYIHVPSDGSIESEVHKVKRSYAGDEVTETYRLKIIEVSTGEVQSINYRPLVPGRFGHEFFSYEGLGWWAKDSQSIYFVDIERDHKRVRVISANVNNGEVRVVFEEESDTFIRLSHNPYPEPPLFKYLPATEELLWFSERDNWGHLYLYDLKAGELKKRVTEGEWVIRQVLDFNEVTRELVVQTSGRDPAINPYYEDVCLLAIDTGQLRTLAGGNYQYIVPGPNRYSTITAQSFGEAPGINGIAPSGNYIVVTRSRVDTFPVSVLINREGEELITLEQAQDIGLPKDWHWPEPIHYISADEETDLYGVIFRPPGFSSEHVYPVLDYSYTLPHFSTLPHGSFTNGLFMGETYLVASAFAALGFIVVCMEVRGTPCRSKSFQDVHYGQITAVNGFDDRIAGMRQLAERYPSMDLSRVGIVSYDGAISPVYGLLEHPDFYKVGINVDFDDERFGVRATAEMYAGTSHFERPYSDEQLARLCGKLLLIHGLKSSSPPEMTLHLVDALQKLNKDFDMVLEPSGTHCVSGYGFRKTWDYLVRHLQQREPPKEFSVICVMERLHEQRLKVIEQNPKFQEELGKTIFI